MKLLAVVGLIFVLIVVPVIAVAAGAPRGPQLLSEYHFENPAVPARDCYQEDSIHRRTWYGSGAVTVGLDFCGLGGASLILAAEGRRPSITVTAPDGRNWSASGRKTATLCVSGFPIEGQGGHAMPEGRWLVTVSGSRAFLHVNVEAAHMLYPRCPEIVDPTL